MQVRVVSFEAWNISRYVFTSNKRREIAGASELITHLDRRWVLECLAELFPGFSHAWRIDKDPVELVAAGAATVKLLIRDSVQGAASDGAAVARALVTAVTDRVLEKAPGLDVYGWVGPAIEWGERRVIAEAMREAFDGMTAARSSRPGPDNRFLRLPIMDECATTGLPAAAEVVQPDGVVELRSSESQVKWSAYDASDGEGGLARLAQLAGTTPAGLRRVVQELQDRGGWVGVAYVDGNGLGEVFTNFDDMVDEDTARRYVDTLRDFTQGLDECARRALAAAVQSPEVSKENRSGGGTPPLVLPLILGGDDVVLLCDGRIALRLTAEYLRTFERMTSDCPQIADPLHRAGRASRLSCSAGVAVVKSHHPFDSAARLAADLLLEAKQVKRRVDGVCSGLAFHILYDSSDARLQRLRSVPPSLRHISLVAQPYVVSEPAPRGEWARRHRWSDLCARVKIVNAVDADGERRLPAAQLHRLRQALFNGRPAADAWLAAMQTRYRDCGLGELCGDEGSLFWTEAPAEPGAPEQQVTGLLDALDVAALWGEGAA